MRYAQLVMGPAGSGKVGIVKNMGSRLCCRKIVLALYVRRPVLIVKDRCATKCRLADWQNKENLVVECFNLVHMPISLSHLKVYNNQMFTSFTCQSAVCVCPTLVKDPELITL